MSGSLADFERLEAALAAYHRAEVVAKALDIPATSEIERAAWVDLANAAFRCGFHLRLNETCIDWSARKVRGFQRHFGKPPAGSAGEIQKLTGTF